MLVEWGGWQDEPAGVGKYELEVLPVKAFGEELDIVHPSIEDQVIEDPGKQTIVTLADPGDILIFQLQ